MISLQLDTGRPAPGLSHRYTLHTDGMTVRDETDTVVIRLIGAGQKYGYSSPAAALTILANGDSIQIPLCIRHHWKVDTTRRRYPDAVLCRKSPMQAPPRLAEFNGAYLWQPFASVTDPKLADRMAAHVNEQLGWLHDPDGRYRNIINGVALALAEVPAGWHCTADGVRIFFGCPDLRQALAQAEASARYYCA
jgi:hypothetical protein